MQAVWGCFDVAYVLLIYPVLGVHDGGSVQSVSFWLECKNCA